MTHRARGRLALAALGAALWGPGARASETRPTPSARPSPAACAGQAAWVSQPAPPDFDLRPAVACTFYQHAWQTFLWLTSPSAGPGSVLRFELFPAVDEVFGVNAREAAAGLGRYANLDPRSKRKRFFRPRVGKALLASVADQSAAGETTQAGSGGILVDQAGEVTYYEQLLDPRVAVPFIDACSLRQRACWAQPGAAKLRFPNGAIEIKAAWRPMSGDNADLPRYYTIPGFLVQNAKGQTSLPDFMALVGFHLAFAIEGHPEMVWATFEHLANAPPGPCVAGQATCAQLPAGFKAWTYNDCAATSCAGVNAWPFPASPTPAPPYPLTQAFLNWPGGIDPTLVDGDKIPGGATLALLEALNSSVLSLLPKDSPWRNYSLSGAVWTSGGRLPALAPYLAGGERNPGVNVAGSTLLASATMETFTQFPNPAPVPFPGATPAQNCFTCHNTASSLQAAPPPTQHPPFRVSHAFGAAPVPSPLPACPYTATAPPQCLRTQGRTPAARK